MKSADWMAVPESPGDMPLKRLEKKNLGTCGLSPA